MKKIYIAVFIAVLLTPFLSTSIMAESDRITIKGSTTVLPIAQRTAEVFMNNHPM